MDQYISKTEIENEVKRHLDIANTGIKYAQSGINYGLEEYKSDLTTWTQCQYTCRNILAFLDTLETKEVDLEAELNTWRHNHFHGRRDDKGANGEYLTRDSQLDIAKHFYELGLKTKEE